MDNFTQLVDLTERWRTLEHREVEAWCEYSLATAHYPRPVREYADLRPKVGEREALAMVEADERGNRRASEALEAWRAVNLDQRLVLAELRDLLPLWTLPEADERGRFVPPVRYPPGVYPSKTVACGLDLDGVISRVKAHARVEARHIQASQRPALTARDRLAQGRALESARTEGAARVALIARARASLGPADLEVFDAAVGFGAEGGVQ